MIPVFSRRRFLGHSVGAGAVMTGLACLAPAASAVEPLARTGPPRLRLGLAAYSFRQYFRDVIKPSAPATGSDDRTIDMLQFIDYCADQGCLGAEVTSYFFPKNLDDDYLRQVRRRAFLRGIAISGTAVGNNFTLPKGPKRDAEIADVKRWIDRATLLGTSHIRIFAGSATGPDGADARRLCIEAIEECCDYAGQRGIFLGLENHGGIVAEPAEVLEIMRAVKSPWLGVNLDTGNFHTDPYNDLIQCASYAVNVQIKVEIQRKGQPEAEPADLTKVIGLLRAAGYQGFVALEYESKPDPWIAVPIWLKRIGETMVT